MFNRRFIIASALAAVGTCSALSIVALSII